MPRASLNPEPYQRGDKVRERTGRATDLVLTVASCVGGYVHAELWEKHPDRKLADGSVLEGPWKRPFASQGPAREYMRADAGEALLAALAVAAE